MWRNSHHLLGKGVVCLKARKPKHPIQRIRRPMPPPTRVKPDKRREEDKKPARKEIEESLEENKNS